MNNSVDTVFFDFDGTLVFQEPDPFDVLRAFCAEIGQPLTVMAERQGRRAAHQFFADPVLRQQIGGLVGGDFWLGYNRHLLQVSGIQGDLNSLAAAVMAHVEPIELTYYCPPTGCQTLAELHKRGYQLGLITNREHVARFYRLLDEMELRTHFDTIVVSGEVGLRKPEPAIFYAALERAGTTPDRAVYVGDNYWADVVGAWRAGVTPTLLDPYGLFPEADCLILERIDGLLAWL